MLFKFELKKLFIKQHALVLIIIAAVVKIFTSGDLFTPDYSVLSKDQQSYYLEYIEQYGGKITDEKERAIISLFERASEASALRRKIEDNYNKGVYESSAEYAEALSSVPEIAREYDAVKYLYEKYINASADRDNRAVLAGDAKAMTSDAEYLLVMLICFISVSTVYYERKINKLVKTTISAEESAAMRAAALFTAIFSAWIIFSSLEFAAVIKTVGADNLSLSAASLDSFRNTPYTNLSILQMFVFIALTKLCGYLLVSSSAVITALLFNNMPLAVFAPFVCTFVWKYLFISGNPTYYSPFSLVLGSPYYTGDFYLRESGVNILIYNAVPLPQTLLLIAVSIAVTVIAVLLLIGKTRGIKRLLASFMTVTLCILCGCSQKTSKDGIYAQSPFNIVSDGENYYAVCDVNDENGVLLESHLTMFDRSLNVVHEELNLRAVERSMCEKIQISGGYLYCKKSVQSENYSSMITRINLNDFHEETVYMQPVSQSHSAYLDLLTVYPNEISGRISEWFVCDGDIYIFTSENKAFCVQNGKSRYLFEDLKINCPAMKDGKIYYLNANGNPVCYDGKKEVMSERGFYGANALNDGFYCYNDSGIYKVDYEDFSDERICDNPGHIIEIYADGILRQSSDGRYVFIGKDGGEKVYELGANEYNIAFFDEEMLVCGDRVLERKDGEVLIR